MKALERRLAVLAPAFVPTCRQCGGALQCRHCDPRPLQRLRAEELHKRCTWPSTRRSTRRCILRQRQGKHQGRDGEKGRRK